MKWLDGCGQNLCRSPRKGLMSPKQPVSNVRRVFGFDAPFDANSGSGGLVSEGRKVPNGTPSTILYPTPPSQGATPSVQEADSTPHSKSKRKSSPPINTPHHFSRHWPCPHQLIIKYTHLSQDWVFRSVFIKQNILEHSEVMFYRVLFIINLFSTKITLQMQIFFFSILFMDVL